MDYEHIKQGELPRTWSDILGGFGCGEIKRFPLEGQALTNARHAIPRMGRKGLKFRTRSKGDHFYILCTAHSQVELVFLAKKFNNCSGASNSENNPHALMQTQWHIKIDCDWQTITHEITPRVRVIVDLSHAIRTIAKDGQAIDTCQFGPDILRHYQWLLRIAEDAEQVNTQNYG